MSWLQLRLDCDKQSAPELEDLLRSLGALSVTLEDRADEPLLEPRVGETPLWNAIRLTGLFTAEKNMAPVLEVLKDKPVATEPRVEILEDKDWEREWMRHYEPMQFGDRLWICPSWKAPPDPSAVNLLLDPGLAFGTGTHPTTAMCLQAIDGMDLDGCSVVDYGCGSGILGIAALRLGSKRLLAVDNDPQALLATEANAERNGVNGADLLIALPDSYDEAPWLHGCNLVIANILAGPLAELAPTLTDFLAPGGRLILAGLLETQAQALVDAYAPAVELEILFQLDEWVCLSGTRLT